MADLKSEQLAALFDAARKRKLVLPNFQRDFVWSLEEQKGLVASLLLDIPIGSLLILSGRTTDFSYRPVGIREKVDSPPTGECDYVLDGQQRLSSLHSIISDPFGGDWDGVDQGKARVQRSFWNLRYRWAIQVLPSQEEDLFGVETLWLTELPIEPELVKARLVPLRVKLGGAAANDWHHPAWKADLPPQQRDLATAQAAADEGLVPLWTVASDSGGQNPLHRQVLQKIAFKNKEILEAKIADASPGDPIVGVVTAAALHAGLTIDTEAQLDGLKEVLPDLRANWFSGMASLLDSMATYQVPIVNLPVEQIDRAIVIFESMNRGGTPLSTFDLLTARLAKSNEEGNLSELIFEKISSCEIPIGDALRGSLPASPIQKWSPVRDSVGLLRDSPSGTFKNSFLAVLSLLASLAQEKELATSMMKETAILGLSPEDVSQYWEQATDSVLRAWSFLQIRCGVRSEGDLRNKLLVIPIALALRDAESLENKKLLDRIEYWYWCSTLTATYTERQNDNAIEDARRILKWAGTGTAGEDPFSARRKRVLDDANYSDKGSLMRENEDAGVATDVGLYLLQFELSSAPHDLISDDRRLFAWSTRTEDHHLVPLGSAKTVLESTQDIRGSNEGIGRLLNSPLNRSLISAEDNRTIGAMNIGQYLQSVPEKARIARGIPELATLNLAQLEDVDGGGAAAAARALMANRFNWIKDKAISRLDSLLY